MYSKMTNADILKLVRAHLYAHVVRMPFGGPDDNYYTQVSMSVDLLSYALMLLSHCCQAVLVLLTRTLTLSLIFTISLTDSLSYTLYP